MKSKSASKEGTSLASRLFQRTANGQEGVCGCSMFLALFRRLFNIAHIGGRHFGANAGTLSRERQGSFPPWMTGYFFPNTPLRFIWPGC